MFVIGSDGLRKTHRLHSCDSPLRSFTSAQAGPSTHCLYLVLLRVTLASFQDTKRVTGSGTYKKRRLHFCPPPIFFLSTYQSFFLLSLNPKFRLRAFSTSTCVYSSNKLVAGIDHDTGSQLHLPPPHTISLPSGLSHHQN